MWPLSSARRASVKPGKNPNGARATTMASRPVRSCVRGAGTMAEVRKRIVGRKDGSERE
jgi:hypothetical protein